MTQHTQHTAAKVTQQTAAAARYYCDLICIWRLCGSTACLRARYCRGDGVSCFKRCLPLVPVQVRDFFVELSEFQQTGFTWDEALNHLPEQWRAVREWSHVVAKSMPAA
jgi:hypothetical protein